MTEAEWSSCKDPDLMLEHLRDWATDRKFRLFICACCRRLLPLLRENRKTAFVVCEKALAVSERFADGLAREDELRVLTNGDIYSVKSGPDILAVEVARRAVFLQIAGDERPMRFGRRLIGHPASEAAEFARGVVSGIAGEDADRKSATARKRAATIQEKAFQIQLLHDLFGNPFRRVRIKDTWVTPTLLSLAQAIYDEQHFDRMPILADALEEAGCTHASILEHCRGPGQHVRGCFVLDLFLGRE